MQIRIAMKGGDRFRWKKGSKPLPYGLWRLEKAKSVGNLVLVEGASDAQTLWYHNIPALGIPGAASWQSDWDASVQDMSSIYVVLEPDQGGEAIFTWITRSSFRDRVKFVRLTGVKDPSELYLRSSGDFLVQWKQAVASAVPWTSIDQERRATKAAAHYLAAASLLNAPDLLNQVGLAMRLRGYAGDLTLPTLIYVGLTSRN